MTKNKNILIALVIGGILAVTSFIPVLQVVIMQLNGALFYPFRQILGLEEPFALIMLDAVLSIIFLSLFYHSEKQSWKIFSSICSALFLLPLLVLLTEDLISPNPYFLQLFLIGIVIGIILFIIANLKKPAAL